MSLDLEAFKVRIKQLASVQKAVAESKLYGSDTFKRKGKFKIYDIVKLRNESPINKERRKQYMNLRGIVVGNYVTFNYTTPDFYFRNSTYRVLFANGKTISIPSHSLEKII